MNCRKGDLAIIVSCSQLPENLGKIVSVLDGPFPTNFWLCESPRPIRVFQFHYGQDVIVEAQTFYILDSTLRPLRDDPPGVLAEVRAKLSEPVSA